MKRLMLAAMLLVSTATVFASETKGNESKEEKKMELNVKQKGECTYSISAKVGPTWGQVEIKCSYTASTCKEAITQANKCVDEARKAIM